MSRINGKNTKIDLKMKQMLTELGCRFEMYPKMLGKPDFIIRKRRIVIFCDGDFWHGFKYGEKKKPAKKFWRDKIEGNMKRDKKISRRLRRYGWSVQRFWEHDIENRHEFCKRKILRAMKN